MIEKKTTPQLLKVRSSSISVMREGGGSVDQLRNYVLNLPCLLRTKRLCLGAGGGGGVS